MSNATDPLRLLGLLAREHAMGRPEHVVEAFHDLTPFLLSEPALLLATAEQALHSDELRQWHDRVQIHHLIGVLTGGSDLTRMPNRT